jgi:catechol 2,3-dioxygenase-like lactoylglutathione lyase family enzyme
MQPVDSVADPMQDFGTTASNVFFYYEDLERAETFYRQTLGLHLVADYGMAKILQVAPKSFITLVHHESGMHSADEPKTAAIALVTDQLDEWWDYIDAQDIDMRSESYTPREGSAHDGFVAIDPEGYFLEFERFNPHPENEEFTPVLDSTETLYADAASRVPPGLGFKATVVWFYYKDMAGIQSFYEDVLGFDLIVDQGWAKIYPIGPTGYFGLVDESRGMHNFTETKAVTLSIITDDVDGWYEYTKTHDAVEMRSEEISDTERYRAFVAYDPGGYYLEWDIFKDSEQNKMLVQAINAN